MTVERMIELLEIEKECVLRNASGECNRYCAGCDLLQDDTELHEMYTEAIALLKAQEPVEPTIGGDADGPCRTWWYQCGKCKEAIDYHDKYCRNCRQAVKWKCSSLCSACGDYVANNWKHCQNCGAKLDGERRESE